MLVHLIRNCALITRKIIKKKKIKNEIERNFQFQNLSIFFKRSKRNTRTKNIISNKKLETWNDLINSCRIGERN